MLLSLAGRTMAMSPGCPVCGSHCQTRAPRYPRATWMASLRGSSAAEHSASDREGAGSNPAPGFGAGEVDMEEHSDGAEQPRINPAYPAFQLAKALTTGARHDDPAVRESARRKVGKWLDVLRGMWSGGLSVGSRTPVADVPA